MGKKLFETKPVQCKSNLAKTIRDLKWTGTPQPSWGRKSVTWLLQTESLGSLW